MSHERQSDETTQPTWFDREYLTKILQAYTSDQLADIQDFSIAPATKQGENYGSQMHLVNAKYSLATAPDAVQNASFIMKSRLENELMSQIEEEFNVFHREAQMYAEIMREAHQLLRRIGDESVFGPSAIYVDARIIVQENLKLRGYNIEDVKQGLNLAACRLVIEKLAKFHAVTTVLYKKNPDMFRHHLPGNVSEQPTLLHDLYTNSIQATIDYCKTNSQLQQYVPKLEEFGEKVIAKMINVFSRNQADRFHCLNHGDVWINNLMFSKNANGDVEDVLFVDYQEGFYGSPGIDWNYFMFSSWQKEVFLDKREDLIAYYHGILSDVLHRLNYEHRIPTLDDIKKEIINKGFHGLSTATCIMPILINEYADLIDPLNFLLQTDEACANRRKVFDNPKLGTRLESFLPYFVENGIL